MIFVFFSVTAGMCFTANFWSSAFTLKMCSTGLSAFYLVNKKWAIQKRDRGSQHCLTKLCISCQQLGSRYLGVS